jgi:hypothetical protein
VADKIVLVETNKERIGAIEVTSGFVHPKPVG